MGRENNIPKYNTLQPLELSKEMGTIVKISAGSEYALILDNQGQVWSTDCEDYSQIERSDIDRTSELVFIANLLDHIFISCLSITLVAL